MSGEQLPHVEHISPLLVYFRNYGVLVCKSCEFAIQPTAIDAHLLRHKIYREKRQRLLAATRKLPLLRPHDVQQPDGRPPAFPYLSVATGFKCGIQGCEHLCASAKRMTQHLREQHGSASSDAIKNSSIPVRLQTFFRGNQVRYFQISDEAQPSPPATKKRVRTDSSLVDRTQQSSTSASVPSPLTKPAMEDLMYLHHYITSAGLAMARGPESPSFWTHDLPLYATEHSFLMHGMLSVAAYHQALNEVDSDRRRQHKEACLQHQSAGLALFRALVSNPVDGTHMPLMAFARLLGTTNGVNYFVDAGIEDKASSSDSSSVGVSPLLEFMNMLKGGVSLLLDLQPILSSDSVLRAPAEVIEGLADLEIPLDKVTMSVISRINDLYAQLKTSIVVGAESKPMLPRNCGDVRQLINLCLEAFELAHFTQVTPSWVLARASASGLSISSAREIAVWLQSLHGPGLQSVAGLSLTPCPLLLCYPNIPPGTYNRLSLLPSLLRDRLPMLDASDMEAFDQAMAILVSCYSRSNASDTTWARWNGIESFPKLLPSHFYNMIERREPWALVVVAHWCVLIARQEPWYWHLQGQSERLLKSVLANLDPSTQDLVRSCIEPLLRVSQTMS